MPRKKGMIGPGATAMGGAGVRPGRMATSMAGRSPLAAPGGLPGIGAGPRPPMGGPSPGGQPVARSPAAGMGGAAGFKHGGEAEKKRERHEKLAHGGTVGSPSETIGKAIPKKQAFAKGGPVGLHGSDTKARHAVHHGIKEDRKERSTHEAKHE